MSCSFNCKCGERKKPIAERRWRIIQYMCNHSAFNGYHRTPSDYSTVVCDAPGCTGCGRTKANYVFELMALGKHGSTPEKAAINEAKVKAGNNEKRN